jgi:hypothetical protein
MTEKQLAAKLKSWLPKDAHWMRLENAVGVGAPDINVCYLGFEEWWELKVKGQAPIRPAQKVWHAQRERAGGRSFILLYNPETKVIEVLKWCIIAEDFLLFCDFAFTKQGLATFIDRLL